jgi:hypothetical protein
MLGDFNVRVSDELNVILWKDAVFTFLRNRRSCKHNGFPKTSSWVQERPAMMILVEMNTSMLLYYEIIYTSNWILKTIEMFKL